MAAINGTITTVDTLRSHTFEIVDHAPDGYFVWNIGKSAPAGFVPLAERGEDEYSVNTETLKAVQCDEWLKVTSAAAYANTYEAAREFIRENGGAETGWKGNGNRLLKEVMPYLKRIFVTPAEWDIRAIEALTAQDIEGFEDTEHVKVKGHDVYFVDFGRCFGYSAVVCAEGRHIYHANEYQLHYDLTNRREMRETYVRKLEAKLFTDEELLRPSGDYDERQAKDYYIRNLYSMRREFQSMFGNASEWYEREKAAAVRSLVAFAYYHAADQDFVSRMDELHHDFEAANDPLRDYEHAYDAFLREMYNHEYAISWQGDWDVIRCFAHVDGENADDMLPKTGWNDEIKRAYRDAAREAMSVEY